MVINGISTYDCFEYRSQNTNFQTGRARVHKITAKPAEKIVIQITLPH